MITGMAILAIAFLLGFFGTAYWQEFRVAKLKLWHNVKIKRKAGN